MLMLAVEKKPLKGVSLGWHHAEMHHFFMSWLI